MVSKKKIIASVATVAIVVTMGVGATLAYFTDKDDVSCTFNTGRVSGEIKYSILDIDDSLLPGDVVYVDEPEVVLNNNSEDAYVRIKLNYADNLTLGDNFTYTDEFTPEMHLAKVQANIDAVIADFMSDDWFLGDDGYWYFQKVLSMTDADGNVTEAKLSNDTSFTIPLSWDNAMRDVKVKVDVSAELIQAENFTPGTVNAGTDDAPVMKINSWSVAGENESSVDPTILDYTEAY